VCWRRVSVPGPRRRHPGTDRETPGHRLSLKWRARRVGAWSSRECQGRSSASITPRTSQALVDASLKVRWGLVAHSNPASLCIALCPMHLPQVQAQTSAAARLLPGEAKRRAARRAKLNEQHQCCTQRCKCIASSGLEARKKPFKRSLEWSRASVRVASRLGERGSLPKAMTVAAAIACNAGCGELSSLLTVKTLTGMTTDVYPRATLFL
jgi:hypothetical protein